MASGDPRDPQFGLPYVGTPAQQTNTYPVTKTVLNMYKLKNETITATSTDNHYTPNGDLYHE